MNKIIVSLLLLVLATSSCNQVEFVNTTKTDSLLSVLSVFGRSYDAVITPSATGPTNASPIALTITFNEPVTGFDASDVNITGTGTATVTSVVMVGTDGTTYTITITPTGDGVITVGVNDAAAQKPDGTPTGAVRPATVTYDSAVNAITATIASNNANSSYARVGDRITLAFTANEALVAPAVTIDGNAATIAGGPVNWTATYVMTAGDIEGVIPFVISGIQDLAGNTASNVTSTTDATTVTFDRTAPDVTINQAVGQTDPDGTLPINFTVVFSEPIAPATFAAADVNQTGSATGVTWTLTNSGDDTTWTLAATAATGQGTLVPSIAAGRVTDPAGNANTASTSTDNSVTYDTSAPSVTINQAVGQNDPTNTLPINFTVVFSKAINPATFTVGDITESGTASGITWSLSTTDNITWTLSATAVTGAGTLVPSIAAGAVTDPAGNANTASTSTDNSVTYDTTAPTVTVNQAGGQSDPTNTLPVSFTVVFSKAINPATFTVGDITESGTASGITWSLSTTDNITWTLSATAVTGAGTLVPSIAAGAVTDPAGNANTISTSTDNSVTYDTTAPTVTVNQSVGQSDPTGALPINFTIVFSKAINPATFDMGDITQSGTASGITWTLSTADNITWTLAATAVIGQGTLVPSIAAGRVTDPAGNANTVSTSTDNSVTYDTSGPSVTVNQSVGQSDPTNAAPINFTVVFSEAINPATFTVGDITESGTATGITWSLSTTDNITWTLSATAVTGQGTIVPSIAAGAVTDPDGNANTASTSTDNSVTYDTTAPSVTINQAVGQNDPTNTLPINFTVVFSKAINPATFTVGDITESGTASGITWSLSTADNITWTLSATAVTGAGSLVPSIAAGAVTDAAGNANTASTSTDNSVTYDTTAPTVTVNQAGGQSDPTNTLPVSFTVVFSKAINPATFAVGDITQSGTASGITWNITNSGDDTTWTLTATATTGHGTVIPSIDAGAVTDMAGNGNTASTATDNSVFYCSDNNTISTITATPALTWDNAFDVGIFTYNINVDAPQGTIDIGVSLADANASVTINGTLGLTRTITLGGVGSTTAVTVIATSQCGTVGATYTLNVHRLTPDITVQVGGSDITTYDFGTVYQPLTSIPVAFTIRNTGTGSLNVTGSSKAGTNASDFTVSSVATGILVPGGTRTFTVIFTPGATGARSATFSIASDDPDENPYVITLSGTGGSGPAPEINVKLGATDYPSGSTYDFGDVYPGSAKSVAFTIENTGPGTLTLTGAPLTGTSRFAVDGPDYTSIPGYGSVTFTATFIPAAAGTVTDTLTINSDDADESAYAISLSGTGAAAAVPDIDVSINGTEYLSGSTYDFGDVQSGDSGTVTLTISNSGSTDLSISSDAMNQGTNYSEAGPGLTLVPAGGSTTLDVTFSPTGAGPLTDYIEIGSNDTDEPTYQINFTGNGTLLPAPDISVEAVAVTRPSGSCFDFEALYGGSAVTVTFTIENLGNATLELYAPYVALNGHHAADYSIITYPSSTSIAPSGTATFEIEFAPSAKGLREASIMIPSNDPDKATYIVNLRGVPVIPLMMVHGGGLYDSSVYDPTTNTFSAGVTMMDMVDVGGHSFLIDSGTEAGKYMIIHGGGAMGTTLYDPGVPPAAPTVSGTYTTVTNIDSGAHTFKITGGAHVGEFLVVCGGVNTINLFNPATPGFELATFTLGSIAYIGSFHFTNDDNDMVVINGNNTAGYRVFDQDGTNTFGALQSIPTAQIWNGGHGSRIISGMYPGYMLIIEGGLSGSNRTWLFDPSTTPTHAAGPNLSGTAYSGSFSIPIVTGPYAGKTLVVHGNNTTGTSIYDSVSNTMTAGPALPTAAADGAFFFKITGGPYKGWYKILYGVAADYLRTALYNPKTMQFTGEGENLSIWVGPGASTFPAR